MGRSPDVVVVGAGVVGASCAYYLAAAGVRVRLYDRSFIASGSSGSCEGNVLAWDKELERELPLALRSADLWQGLSHAARRRLRVRPQGQRRGRRDRGGAAGVRRAQPRARRPRRRGRACSTPTACAREEPYAAHDLPGGVLYPGDAQLEPRLATAALVRAAVALGAELCTDVDGRRRSSAAPTGAPRASRRAPAASARTWSSSPPACGPRSCWRPRACRFRSRPRKGQIVVLERSPVVFRRKLSEAGYVAAVEADDAELQIAMVVESTPSGTALLGSSRQHMGFDRTVELGVAGAIARRAARFFPILNDARALRVYAGLRPLTPDHVPIIGPFARGAEHLRRDRPRGRRHRPRARHRRARRRLAHGRAVAGADRVVLARPLRARRAGRVMIELTVDGRPLTAPAGQSLAAVLLQASRAVAARQPGRAPARPLLRDRRLPGVPRRRRRRRRALVRHPGQRRACASPPGTHRTTARGVIDGSEADRGACRGDRRRGGGSTGAGGGAGPGAHVGDRARRACSKAGELTSVELTKAYIDRIAAVNQRGPALNAVRSLNPNALKEARVSDLARRTHSVRGPLEGLPVLLKDNIDVAGMPTTASSIVLEHSVPDKDAFVVQRLKAAGAVILGKVNLTEFAAWVSNNQSSGNGSLHGQVLNPYDTSTDPGGSSAGLRRRRGGRPGRARARLGHRGLDPLARDPERRRRHPAHDRPVEPHRRRADLRVPGHARPARADHDATRRCC